MPPTDHTVMAAAVSNAAAGAGAAAIVAVVALAVIAFSWVVKDYYDWAIWAGVILGLAVAVAGWFGGFQGWARSFGGSLVTLGLAVFLGLYTVHHMRSKKKAHRKAIVAAIIAPTFILAVSWGAVGHQISAWLGDQASKTTSNVQQSGR